METKLKIKVTKDVLERSKMCGVVKHFRGDSCAIALAVRDVFPEASVGFHQIFPLGVAKGWQNIEIPITSEVTQYIKDFDGTDPADRPNLPEIEFEITIPDEVIAQINIEEIRPLLVNHPTLELI